ncbi:alkaline phosphatase PhoX, partial [Streptomyces hirsutus]|uniref:alkaline phosphatase PhoX n=1 Tax=Streptomyces hirsutus TaxID=35620 RepID=UPI0012FF3208
MSLTRRDFARTSAVAGAGVALVGSVGALASAPGALASHDAESEGEDRQEARHQHPTIGYGPLLPDPDGILALPAGFSYRVLTHCGKTRLESGEYTPAEHDGTAAFAGPRGTTLLVNNHEMDGPRDEAEHPVPLVEGLVYDPGAPG